MPGLRNMDPGPKIAGPLQHRGSTKQLIGQFESMSNSPRNSRIDHVYSGKPLVVPLQHASSISQKKDKSPIRRSFRNLFSVFKKATMGIKNDTQGDLVPAFPVAAFPILKSSSPSRSITRVFSGPLLYLLRPPCPAEALASPRWITCTATLEDGRIMISPTATQGLSIIHTIYLSHCADVRSLTVQQLDLSESVLLQRRKDIGELRVFEILFEGRVREKFAATSIRDRAGWVSAIWDAILPSQEPKNADREVSQSSEDLGGVQERSEISPHLENAVDARPPLKLVDLIQPYTERLLPPIPSNSSVSHHQTKHPLVTFRDRSKTFSTISPSICSPSRSASRASSKRNNSQSTSPSIVNLGRLSVVQQRLAQIERKTSQQSSGSRLRSPTSSSRDSRSTPLTAPSPQFRQVTNAYDILGLEQLKRTESVKSSSTKHMLDSYGDTRPGLPNISATEEPDHVHNSELTNTQQSSPHPTDGGMMSRLEPLAELLRDHAAKNYDQTANLGDQIISLQDEVQRLPQELAYVVSDSSTRADIHKTISSLEAKTGANGEALKAINENLRTIGESALTSDDTVEIRQTMRDVRQQLKNDIPIISQKLDMVQQRQEQDSSRTSTTLKNLGSSLPDPLLSASHLLELHEKVDALITLCQPNSTVGEQGGSPLQHPLDTLTPELAEIRAFLEENKSQRILQSNQQAESVRYLNELNTWLETFVNNGTSQIHNMSVNIERLSQYLGFGLQQPEGFANGSSGLLTDINQTILDIQARDPSLATLQTSMDGLLTVMNESQKSLNMAAVANLIDRQRQDQEGLFRALTNKISDEIKGERLRFVEAMKEATAINVQIHVEQFKAELSREVSGMTEQVKRLHRERQAMETQIADLFAFYTKQKEAVGPLPAECGCKDF